MQKIDKEERDKRDTEMINLEIQQPKRQCTKHGEIEDWFSIDIGAEGGVEFCTMCVKDLLLETIGSLA